MHIERGAKEKILTGVLVVTAAVFSAVYADFLSRPYNEPRVRRDTAGSLINPPGPETIQRSSASHYERLNIPLLPYQR